MLCITSCNVEPEFQEHDPHFYLAKFKFPMVCGMHLKDYRFFKTSSSPGLLIFPENFRDFLH